MLPATTSVVGSLVWVRVWEEDDEQAAQLAANQLADAHLRHFYDPQQRAARDVAVMLGGTGSYAWDTYLVFSPGQTWNEAPPWPSEWAHQLDHTAWAPEQRRRKGQALVDAIWHMIGSA
jgi:hypothetical protein